MSDLIDRQAAYDALMEESLKWDDSSVWESARCYQWMMDMNVIKALPPSQPERKKGKWIKHDTGHSVYFDCSLCGCLAPNTETEDKFLWKLSNYCPDCGADMRGEE